MNYTGFYVNLDRSQDRRRHIEGELARHGPSGYARFSAVDGATLDIPNPLSLKPGEIGCFASHHRLLDQNRHSDKPLHVIEDDIILAPQTGDVLNWAIANGHLAKYDIVFTDVAVPLLNDACHAYKNFFDAAVHRDAAGKIDRAAFNVIDMRELIFASTCSFLVNPQSIGKLADLFGDALKTGAPCPVDLYIRKLCQDGVIKVGCIFPFVTSIRPESCFETIIGRDADQLATLAANLLRHSFFIGADWKRCLDYATKNFPQPAATDEHRQMMLRLLGFTLATAYRKR